MVVGFWFNLPSISSCDESFLQQLKILWKGHKRNWEVAAIGLSQLEIWMFLYIPALWLCPLRGPGALPWLLYRMRLACLCHYFVTFGRHCGWVVGCSSNLQGLFSGSEWLFRDLLSLSVFLIQSLPATSWPWPGLLTKTYVKRCMCNC